MSEPSPSSKPWLAVMLGKKDATLEQFFEEFTTQFGDRFGLKLDNETADYIDISNISPARYEKILKGEDVQISSHDVLDYNDENRTLMMGACMSKDILKQWFVEQLPRLFAPSFAIGLDRRVIDENTDSLQMLLRNYQHIGLIASDVKLAPDASALDSELTNLFQQSLQLYTAASPSRSTP